MNHNTSIKNSSDWNRLTLGDLIDVLTDYTANGSFEALKLNVTYYTEQNYSALVRTTDLEKKNFKPERFTDKRGHDFQKKTALYGGEIVLANVGSVGKVYRVPTYDTPMTLAPNTYLVKFSKDHCDEYIFQFLKSEYYLSALYRNISSTTLAAINKDNFRSIPIDIPKSLSEQEKIANILNTVDNLIDQTQNLIDKYTAVKQGMIADLLSRGIDLSGTPETNKSYGQLRPSYEEAPEVYQESELGWIPVSWEVVTLESISTVERGKFTHRPRDDERCYGGIHPFIQTGSVTKSQGGFITEYKQTLSDFGRNVSKEFPAGTIAVTIAANIADTGILEIPMCFPDSVVGVVVNNDFATTRFVEIAIRRSKRKLDALAPLSAQKNINLEDLRPLKLALPNIDEQKELCRRYETQELLIQQEKAYLEKLNLKKKGLMQDLLTGKVKV